MYTDKDLFEKALGYFLTNSDEVTDDIWYNDDWSQAVIWEPFENWEIDSLHDQVVQLQLDFIQLRNLKN